MLIVVFKMQGSLQKIKDGLISGETDYEKKKPFKLI